MGYESPHYLLIKKEKRFEVRKYQSMIVAKVSVSKKKGGKSLGFRKIFSYISGHNQKMESISMTVPVLNWEAEDQYFTAFVMPHNYLNKPLPLPDDPEIKFEKVTFKKVAVYRFNGSISSKKIASIESQLYQWLQAKGYNAISEARLARYNPPFSFPYFRRNELLIEINDEKGEDA